MLRRQRGEREGDFDAQEERTPFIPRTARDAGVDQDVASAVRSLSHLAGNQAVARMLSGVPTGASGPLLMRCRVHGQSHDISGTVLGSGGGSTTTHDDDVEMPTNWFEDTGDAPVGETDEDTDIPLGMFDEVTTTPSTPIVSQPPPILVPKPSKRFPSEGSLRERILEAIKEEVDPEQLVQGIRSAPRQQRVEAGTDRDLVTKLREGLDPKQFVPAMVALEVRQEGTVRHLSPGEGDRIVRDELDKWVRVAAGKGAQLEGKVTVLTGEEWNHAILAHFRGKMPGGMISDMQRDLNAFFRDDMVVIGGDRGNAGTMIHEAIHKYSSEELQKTSGQALNEGVTEHFARQITSRRNIERTQYAEHLRGAEALIAAVREETVGNAYFHGDMTALREAFIRFRKTKVPEEQAEKDWKTYLQATEGEQPGTRWQEAIDLLEA